jgi:cytidyltransferase-like protein
MDKRKRVFVTGCFDMLHSGHIAFFKEAAEYGDLYVGLGSDSTLFELKGRYPINNQDERKYMIDALASVKECIINTGSGIMDFLKEIESVKPDIFIVNEDGNTPAKEELSAKLGIEYIVLKRVPHKNLPVRSTTALRSECTMPYRIDLAGGWLDQPFVSKYVPGSVLTISIEPTVEFNERSGMASSTRRRAIELWHTDIPSGDREQLAKILFSYENPPGTKIIAGSQDSIGIVMPGLNKLDYKGSYWPEKITSIYDENILTWMEKHLYLITLGPRDGLYDVLENTVINKPNARDLKDAAESCWESILNMDLKNFGLNFRKAFEAQYKMFPNMVYDEIFQVIDKYKNLVYGWKLSGAGGGGYLIFVAENPIEGAIQVKIRRPS